MQGTNRRQSTNRIYEEPSRLSLGLVVVLSIAVVLMAGWFAVTVMLPQTAATSVEGASDAAATAMPADGAALPTTLRQPARSVHFDWPEEFASATATPAPSAPASTALPLAPSELPAHDPGQAPWPVARDRGLPAHPPAGAETADAIVDLLVPPAPSRAAATAAREAAAPPRPVQRRQKPRTETEAAQ